MNNAINLVETMQDGFDNAKVQKIQLDSLQLDLGTQQRAALDKLAIENYTVAMTDGKAGEFPPLKVVRLNHPHSLPDGSELESGALVLVDGFQRTEAAHNAKIAVFQAQVIDGSLEDAIYYSMGANKTNGANLKGKDYRKAIENLYKMSSYWREHGRKQEIAKLLGCSEKSVSRATKAIDDDIKKQAFEMFESGASDKEVADFAVKSLPTIKKWRDEWEQSKAGGSQDEDQQNTQQSSNDDAGTNNPMDLTFAQVLQLKDSALKAQLLKLLMDSVKQDSQQPEPEPEPEDVPPFDTDEQAQGSPVDDLAAQWEQLDCWGILGITKEQVAGWKNPKTSLKRAYSKQLKRCHPDKYGDNKAAELLAEALTQVQKYVK